MTIKLKPEQEKFLQEQIATGKYSSTEELIDKMFSVFEQLSSEYDAWVVETRQKVELAAEEIERGEAVDGEITIAELLEKFQQAQNTKLVNKPE